MKYYKEFCGRMVYVLSRKVGFAFDDNRIGASYDFENDFSDMPTLHSKQMKIIIRRMWKITVRQRNGKKWALPTDD
jgi:hypothetical protein